MWAGPEHFPSFPSFPLLSQKLLLPLQGPGGLGVGRVSDRGTGLLSNASIVQVGND